MASTPSSSDWIPGHCTVVIPAYNAEAFIQDTLNSVLAQSTGHWEAVVVDDGSTDTTAAIVEQYPDKRVRLIRQPNGGVSVARTRGLAEVRTEFLVFLDSDDMLELNALERMVTTFEQHADAVAVYGEALVMNEAGVRREESKAPLFNQRPTGDVLESLVAQNFIASPGVLCIRTDAMKQCGGFRKGLRVAEDWECWCRLALIGPFIYLGPTPVLAYRHRGESVVRSTGLTPDAALENVEAVYANPDIVSRLGASLPRMRKKTEAAFYSFTASQHLRDGNWPLAREYLLESLKRDPSRTREWILFACALLRWLPPPIARRMK